MAISIEMRYPSPNAQGVSREATVVLTLSAPGEVFTDVQVRVNDTLAYTLTGFKHPAFDGEVHAQAGLKILAVSSRRRFDPDSLVTISVRATTDLSTEAVYQAEFHAVNLPGSLRDTSLRNTRVDSSFPSSLMSLDMFRRALRGAFGTGNGSYLTLLVHRVMDSQLRSLIPKQPDSVYEAMNGLIRTEVAPISELSRVVTALSFAWQGVETELAGIGVDPLVISTMHRSFSSSYAQEQVAAVCLAVLLAAAHT